MTREGRASPRAHEQMIQRYRHPSGRAGWSQVRRARAGPARCQGIRAAKFVGSVRRVDPRRIGSLNRREDARRRRRCSRVVADHRAPPNRHMGPGALDQRFNDAGQALRAPGPRKSRNQSRPAGCPVSGYVPLYHNRLAARRPVLPTARGARRIVGPHGFETRGVRPQHGRRRRKHYCLGEQRSDGRCACPCWHWPPPRREIEFSDLAHPRLLAPQPPPRPRSARSP